MDNVPLDTIGRHNDKNNSYSLLLPLSGSLLGGRLARRRPLVHYGDNVVLIVLVVHERLETYISSPSSCRSQPSGLLES